MKYALPPDTLTPVPNAYQSPQQRLPGVGANPLPPSPFTPPVAQVAPTISQTNLNGQGQTGYNSQPLTSYNIEGGQSSYYSPPESYNTGEQGMYHPVTPHWCYCKRVELKECWYTFSLVDSIKLEEAYNSGKNFLVNTCYSMLLVKIQL